MGTAEVVGDLRHRWAWRGARTAAVALCLVAAVVPIATAAGASGPPKHSFAYYNLHPCLLITASQVASVFGVPVGPGQATPSHSGGGQCQYHTTKTMRDGDLGAVVYGFAMGTAGAEKYYNQGPFVNEPSLGHGAFCTPKGADNGSLYANAGSFDGSPENLNVGGDNSCPDSVRFAKDAFARLP